MKRSDATLPPFAFPVVAWAPEPATGDPGDDGTRAFLTPDEVTTTYMPNSDLRLGWTFVDATGRCWEANSSRVVGRAEARWARWFVWDRRYRLEIDFAERPSIAFDSVKTRLHAAVTANPEVYRDDARERRKELRAARNLRDLIKSDEARAIERLRPQTPWEQWLFWEGRCSRRGFLGASATFFLAIWLVGVAASSRTCVADASLALSYPVDVRGSPANARPAILRVGDCGVVRIQPADRDGSRLFKCRRRAGRRRRDLADFDVVVARRSRCGAGNARAEPLWSLAAAIGLGGPPDTWLRLDGGRASIASAAMLSVIVTPGDSERLVGLLAALTPAAVEGLVREVRIVAGPPPELMEALCEESGAEPAAGLKQAAMAARSDWLLVLPPELRLKDGWVERLQNHLRAGVREAVLQGEGGGLFRSAPYGVVVTRAAVERLAHPDLQRLRRQLGRGAARLG